MLRGFSGIDRGFNYIEFKNDSGPTIRVFRQHTDGLEIASREWLGDVSWLGRTCREKKCSGAPPVLAAWRNPSTLRRERILLPTYEIPPGARKSTKEASSTLQNPGFFILSQKASTSSFGEGSSTALLRALRRPIFFFQHIDIIIHSIPCGLRS